MIYKPNIVYPNMESVPVESELSPFDIYLKGLASSPVYNEFRFSINDTYFKHYTFDEIKEISDNYYLGSKIGEEIENSDGVTVRGFENENGTHLRYSWEISSNNYEDSERNNLYCYLLNNKPFQWRARVYEKASLSDSENALINGNFSYSKAWDNSFDDNVSFVCRDYVPTSCIGYGTVQSQSTAWLTSQGNYVISSESSWWSEGSQKYIDNVNNGYKLLKIYPHIFSKPVTVTFVSKTKGSEIFTYYTYDKKYERYYIKIGGVYYKILDWRYSNWLDQKGSDTMRSPIGFHFSENKPYTSTMSSSALDNFYQADYGGTYTNSYKPCTDGYGNPLALYVLVKDLPDDITGQDYTLYCNYIETDSHSFELIGKTSFSFYDKKQSDIVLISCNTSEDALDENNLNTINYSNFDLSCNINYTLGTCMSHYSVDLYQIQNGRQVLIDKTNDIYAQSLAYTFDRMINNQTYLVHVKIVDNKNIVYDKYIGIHSDYGALSKLLKADVKFDYKNHYNVIDFSSALSISGQELVRNGHSFIKTEVSEYLHLNEGNVLTYQEIDGVKELSITQPLLNTVIKLDYDTEGELWRLTDDNDNTYALGWNGIEFVYTTVINGIVSTYVCYPYEYEIGTSEWLNEMMTNLESPAPNTSVPYVWNETFSQEILNSDLYIHTETPANQCWWSIIAHPDGIRFINLTLNTVWDGVKTEDTEVA